jgi:hypothetical protein
MSGTKRKPFELIGEVEEAPAAPTPDTLKPALFTAVNANILLLSLRALSQRTAMEIARLGSIAFTAGLIWANWLLVSRVLPDPTPLQLYALGGFAVFCLLIETVRRRK